MHTIQIISQGSMSVVLMLCWLWGSLALYYSGPGPDWYKYFLLIIFLCSLPVIVYLEMDFWQKSVSFAAIFMVLLAWWIPLKATNDKEWAPEVARIPYAEIENDILILHNVRNFKYETRTIFTECWETRRYDLEKLETLDIFLSYWGSRHIAHIIMSWGFSDGEYLAISIETRKNRTQAYSKFKGFFKQFTLAYVAADEKDLIRLRTNYRKEEVYGYRIKNLPAHYKRYLLESYINHMNKLIDKPEFYHALLQNCTTGISQHYKTLMPNKSWIDWRLIANGHMDKLLYDLGLVDTTLPFDQLRKASRIDLRMQELGEDNFSNNIRSGSLWQEQSLSTEV
jgi:hypothetical protein